MGSLLLPDCGFGRVGRPTVLSLGLLLFLGDGSGGMQGAFIRRFAQKIRGDVIE